MAKRGSRGKAGERFAAWLESIRLARFDQTFRFDELKVSHKQPGKDKNRLSSD